MLPIKCSYVLSLGFCMIKEGGESTKKVGVMRLCMASFIAPAFLPILVWWKYV